MIFLDLTRLDVFFIDAFPVEGLYRFGFRITLDFDRLSLRDNLKPIIIRVGHKINSHIGIFITDATHLLMAGMGGGVVVDLKGQVEFVVPEIVGLCAVAQPGQFELMGAAAVFKVDDDEAAVRRVDTAYLIHIEGILIELDTLVKIENVEVIVNHSEFHNRLLPSLRLWCNILHNTAMSNYEKLKNSELQVVA